MLFLKLLATLCLTSVLLSAQEKDAWDFVPGEKILLYDDYTDMPRGAAPPHWKVRGSAVRLVGGRIEGAAGNRTVLWPNVAKWPPNFTIESEVFYNPPSGDDASTRV